MADIFATAFVEIVPELKAGFQEGIRRDVDKAVKGGKVGEDAGKKTGKGFVGGVAGSLKGLAGIVGGAFAVQKVIGFFGSTITAASDLGETVNAVNVTFGNAAKGILQLGKNASTSVGLSTKEFNQLAVQFSAFAEGIAGPGGNVTKVIDDITKRAADFASVMNLEVADAAQIFQSALAGETEPIKKFGIDLSAATVTAFAYKEGIAASGEELTESQKTLARYGLLMKSTSKTQGDFANTSDGLANRQRILKAEWENMKAVIGNALLPVVSDLVGAFTDFLPTLQKIGTGISSILGPAIKTVVKFVKDLFSQFRSGVGESTAFGEALRSVGSTFRAIFSAILPLVQQFGAILGPALQRIGTLISGTLAPAFARFFALIRPILTWLIQTVGGALIGAFEGAIQFISGALEAISGLLDIFVGIFTGDWRRAWNGIKTFFMGIWNAIKGFFNVVWNLGIIRLLRVGLSIIRSIWNAVWSAIRSFIQVIWNAITAVIRGAVNVIRGILNFFRGLINIIGTPFRAAWNFIKGVLSSMVSGIRTATSNIGGFFRGIWEALKSGARAAVNFAISILNGVIGAINVVIDGINNLPFVDIGRIPKIPKLADGAVVQKATLAMVGEGNEPEAVLPLSKLNSLLNNARFDGVNAPANVSPSFEVMVFVGDTQITDIVDVRIRERERNIRRQVPLRGVR